MDGKSLPPTGPPDHPFKQIIDAHPTALLLSDASGTIRYINRRGADLFGFAPLELAGLSIKALLPDRFKQRHDQLFQGFVQNPQSRTIGQDGFVWGRHRDGKELPIELTLIPIASGSELSVACVIIDRSERTAAQAALISSEARLRDIIDNTAAVVYVKGIDGRYLLVNSQFERVFKLSRDQLYGRTDFEIFPAELAHAFRVNDTHVARSGKILKIDEIAPHDDGPHTYVSVKFPLRDEQDRVYAVAGISTDITDRVRAEAAADELRNRLQLILNAINHGIVGLDRQGEVTFANPTAERLLKSDRSMIAALLPAVAVDVARQTGPITAGDRRRPTIRETTLRRSDGMTFPAEIEVHPLVEHGQQRGAVLTMLDVSDRKRREAIERELKSARAVQQILYPQSWPRCEGFDVAGHVYSAESMCGDYLDFITTSEHDISIAVGDVSGHGFGASLQMVETRACLRTLLRTGHSLADAVTLLNGVLLSDIPSESFITLFAAQINVATRTLSYVTAGHIAWLFRSGNDPRRLTSDGLVLGLDAEQHYETSDPIPLQSGDVLLMPTDGLQEMQNTAGDLFSIDRMLRAVESLRHLSACEIVDGVYHASVAFAGIRRPSDDVTIAVVKVL